MKTLIAVLLLQIGMMAQEKNFNVSFPPAPSTVTVTVSYTLPADDPNVKPLLQAAQSDPAMQPTTVVYYWGDEDQGAKMRNYTQTAYGKSATHTYTKIGKFGIFVVVTDAKNRSIHQAGVSIKISPPVEIEQ